MPMDQGEHGVTLRTRDESLPFAAVIARLATKLGIVALLIGASIAFAAPSGPAHAEPAGDDTVIAFLARGVGNGHGRGAEPVGHERPGQGRADLAADPRHLLRRDVDGRPERRHPDPPHGVGQRRHLRRDQHDARRVSARRQEWIAVVGEWLLVAVRRRDQQQRVRRLRCDVGVGLPRPGDRGRAEGRARPELGQCGGRRTVADAPVPTRLRPEGDRRRLRPADDGRTRQVPIRRRPAARRHLECRRLDAAAETRLASVGNIDFGGPIASNVTGPIVFSTDGRARRPPMRAPCSGRARSMARSRTTGASSSSIRPATGTGSSTICRSTSTSAAWCRRRSRPGELAGGDALRAQSVAARSFAFSQNRYSYARTCDTSSCQVYGGAATRSGAASSAISTVEHPLSNGAIDATSGKVRVWNGTDNVVSTEFSASNGPRTAGGSFPPVDDPVRRPARQPVPPWTRLIDADASSRAYGLSSAERGPHGERPDRRPYDGIWDNRVVLGNGANVSAWDFRNAFGLPSPGFELVPIRRSMTNAASFAFIGDSVGTGDGARSVVGACRSVTDGVFSASM